MSTKKTNRVIQRAKGTPSVSRKQIERAVEKARALRTGHQLAPRTPDRK